MPLPKKERYTIEDIYKLPDGERAELIDGEIFYMTPPGSTHQRILVQLSNVIYNYIKSKNGSCEMFVAPFAVFLDEENQTYVEPDIAVICDTDKIDKRGCHGAPDWVIEIVSPSNRKMDYSAKVYAYDKAGVRDYWIIDPIKRVITVYNFAHEEPPAIYGIDSCVKANIYDDLVIDFSELGFLEHI